MKKARLSADAARMEADLLLADILIGQKRIRDLSAEAATQVKQIQERYSAAIAQEVSFVTDSEKALEKLVKKHRDKIMGEGDRADLPRGSVMIKTERHVKKIKGMLARLKAAGLNIAVRVIKEAVDWDAVEKFDDATLASLGTERRTKDVFSYELKGDDQC